MKKAPWPPPGLLQLFPALPPGKMASTEADLCVTGPQACALLENSLRESTQTYKDQTVKLKLP
jgi:hypothetical protein